MMNNKIIFTILISITIINCYPQNSNDDEYVDEIYDPTSRDFTDRCNNMAQFAGPKACDTFNLCCSEDFVLNKLNDRCNNMAQFAGPKACDTFNLCCSEDFVLNKLNGDRCQVSDPKNHCSLGSDGTGISYSHCKAFNCTAEVTTTTTTTRTTPVAGASSICLSGWSLFSIVF
uniref:Uncharacterized protein n=1 Tax=Panagrolaimus sp. JU765 TaxID=591449 RepID=A0AC34QU98_9BILA